MRGMYTAGVLDMFLENNINIDGIIAVSAGVLFGVNYMSKVSALTEEDQKKISDELKNYTLESDLKREVATAIKLLKEIKCYRGMRHNLWLPVRWQLTRKNAKTAKKLLWRSKVRPVLKK